MMSYKNGDASAFEVLYQRHKGPLYRYVLRQCHEKNIAEELFQDIWMKIINARERYEVKAKFTTYMYQVARNRMIDYYRHNAGQPVNDDEAEVDALESRAIEQPEEQATLNRKTTHLIQFVEQLPDDQRHVFLLKEEAGMSLQQISDTTGVNTETVKSRLRYAVNKLRKSMGEIYD